MALVPYVVEQTGAGERSMDIYSRLLSCLLYTSPSPRDTR